MVEHRVIKSADFETREEGGKRYLDGYYSVFNQPYEVMPGWIETIAPGAFSKSLREGRDVKVLWNHLISEDFYQHNTTLSYHHTIYYPR